MGAWGADSFDNDLACDWAIELVEGGGLDLIRSTIEAVADADEGARMDEWCEVIAACDVVARMQGQFGQQNAYTEEIDAWVNAHSSPPPPDLVGKARVAVERIAGDEELARLWFDDAIEWLACLDALRKRLGGEGSTEESDG